MDKNSVAPDVSVIITAHGEGRLAHRSVRSAERAISYARRQNITVEFIAVLDAPSAETQRYFDERHASFDHLSTVNFRDLGLARNHGVQQATGEYVAFLDADDLFSENWIAAAFQFAGVHAGQTLVLHPEINIYFGRDPHLFLHIDANDPDYTPLNLIEHNYWTALCFVRRDFFLDGNQYQMIDLASGFGYEDWHWNAEVIANGASHRVVPQTCHFLRLKSGSSLRGQTDSTRALFRPTKLFGEMLPGKQSNNDFFQPASEGLDAPHRPYPARTATLPSSLSTNKAQLNTSAVNSPSIKLKGYSPASDTLYRRFRRFAGSLVRSHPALAMIGWEVDYWLASLRRPAPPVWLLVEWKAISEIEPELSPDRVVYRNLQQRSVPRSVIANFYPELDALVGDAPTHVYLLPALNNESIDREAIQLITAVVDATPDVQVVCITTENTLSQSAHRLPRQVSFVELGRRLARFTVEDQALLLVRLLLQKTPQVIHNFHSALGYKLFTDYGPALVSQSHLFASVSSNSEHSNLGAEELWPLPQCIDYLTSVFASDSELIAKLCGVYAIEREKFSVLNFPATSLPRDNNAVSTSYEADGSMSSFVVTLKETPGYLPAAMSKRSNGVCQENGLLHDKRATTKSDDSNRIVEQAFPTSPV